MPAFDKAFEGEIREFVLQPRRTIQCLFNAIADLLRVIWICQSSEGSVKHRFATRIGFAGYHWYPTGHRLEIDNSKSFTAAGHHECIGETEVVGLFILRDVACKHDLLCYPQSLCFGMKA